MEKNGNGTAQSAYVEFIITGINYVALPGKPTPSIYLANSKFRMKKVLALTGFLEQDPVGHSVIVQVWRLSPGRVLVAQLAQQRYLLA